MKTFTILAAVSALATQVSGHYIFQQFSYGGTKYPVYQYIRKNTNMNSPIKDVTSTDLRCNEGGASGANADVIAVTGGSSFTFTTDTPVYHNGPIAIYMAKAPGSVKEYDGSGSNWFKIWERGPTFGSSVTWPLAQTYTASFPSGLPSGEYLLRIEQLGLHDPLPNLPQFYIGCAQVKVTTNGSGSPGPLVAIPGHVKGTEAGYTVNIYQPSFKSYQFLGPSVWSGGGTPQSTTQGPPPTTTTQGPVQTTTTTTTTARATTTTTTARATTTTASSGTVPKYGQCGGRGWTGGTVCIGSTCTVSNEFYSQCL